MKVKAENYEELTEFDTRYSKQVYPKTLMEIRPYRKVLNLSKIPNLQLKFFILKEASELIGLITESARFFITGT